MTLPLIYALQNVDHAIRRKIIYIVKNKSEDRASVNEVIGYVQSSGGIEYARKKMDAYKEDALQILYTYPETPERQAMIELVNYVIDRKY
jgi:octaprenyl-diphosphate synthase